MKKRSLKDKKILVTAGPTWVPIDGVRVITNIFTGRTGCLISEEAAERGAKVTLLLGPGRVSSPSKAVKVIRFKYFEDLKKLIKEELTGTRYDAVIHSAAVSDYRVTDPRLKEKITSAKKKLTLNLVPTLKIVDTIKRYDPKVFLVKFKLELGVGFEKLINIAIKSMKKSAADLIVANDLDFGKKSREAVIIGKDKAIIRVSRRSQLAEILIDILACKL